MHLPTATLCSLLERGLYKAPWQGPNGEIVLLAITSQHKLLATHPHVVPLGADHVYAAEMLWKLLDELDPVSAEESDALRRRLMKVC